MRSLSVMLFLLLAACGGGSNSTSPTTLPLRDTIPPVVTLSGDNPLVVTTGEAYIEPGATATDIVDGDISDSIAVDASSLDTGSPGDYVVTYTVADAAGNSVTVTRTVRVENPPLPGEPQVLIEGDIKRFLFSWDHVGGADFYRLQENPDGQSGFTQVGDDIRCRDAER